MKEQNSFGESATDTGQQKSESQAIPDGTELADALAAQQESRLTQEQELEQACLATGATGAAIGLVRGEEIICHATVGPHGPGLGVCVDPRNGLSGSCIQTRRLQQCVDTQTDPRVDPEVCRHLGVRSIVVLPLIDVDKLVGIVEVLWSQPNAFGQRDLDALQALTGRIVESRRQNWVTTATVPRKEPRSLLHKLEEVVSQDKSHSSESDSKLPRRESTSRRNDIWTPILATLVIGAAVLLGTLMGWRFGWEKATLGLRASSVRYRANAPSGNRGTDHAVLPSEELQPSSAWTGECGQSAAAGPPTQPPSGGLTICQEGRVIFRLPPPAPSPIRGLQTPQRSPGLEAGPTRR